MSYTVSDKLLETFFMDTLTKKAEMLKKHLKDTKSNWVICTNIGPNMATFKFFNPQEEDSLKLYYTFSNLKRFKRTIISIMGPTKLCFKGKSDVTYMYIIL